MPKKKMSKKDRELYEAMEDAIRNYGYFTLTAAGTLLAIRNALKKEDLEKHKLRSMEIVKKLDGILNEEATRAEETGEGSMLDFLAALVYLVIATHVALTEKNESYANFQDAVVQVLRFTLLSEASREMETYKKDEKYQDPSIR